MGRTINKSTTTSKGKQIVEPSIASLWRIAGEGLALTCRGAPGYEARLTPDATLVLSGEPVADFNYALIDEGPKAEVRLREFGQVIQAQGLPVIVILTAAVAKQLAPVASELGLQYADQIPLMVYRPQVTLAQIRNYHVERVESAERLKDATGIMACAFALPRESGDRAFGPAMLEGSCTDVFLAHRDGNDVSAVVTTRAGAIVGIWAMATHPDHQRQGAGRALLDYTIAYHGERGAKLFYLLATEAGKPLYKRIGFETITEGAVWMAGHSTQVGGHSTQAADQIA